MKASIITIGNELLIGDIINTNAAWIGSFLTERSIEVVRSVTVSDDRAEIEHQLDDCRNVSDLIIMTGGLGPTSDDITKKVLCDATHASMTEHKPTLDFITKNFARRSIPLTNSNLEQAMVPDSCEVMFNTRGTAPGMWFSLDNCFLAALPGVPAEMKYLMEQEVWPRVAEAAGKNGSLYRHYFQTAGIGESTLSDLEIGDVSDKTPDGVSLAWLPHIQGVNLRITSTGSDETLAREKARPLIEHIRKKAADHIYSETAGDSLAASCGRLLHDKKLKLAVAESCTGGLLGSLITDVPGSSNWFRGGIVAYHNDLKQVLLDVPESVIQQYGAVSSQTAMAMAVGAARKLGGDIGIATTGIAGPGGGSESKPVGLVWFGYYDRDHHFAVKAQFFKDRIQNKERTALVALDLLRRTISGIKRLPYDAEVISAK